MLNWIEIDLKALVSNARAIRRSCGQSLFMAVVKADAYGHGAERVVQSLDEAGLCDAYGVWSLEEARTLKEALSAAAAQGNPIRVPGRRRPPFALLAPSLEGADGLEWGVRQNVWFSADTAGHLRRLSAAAAKAGKKAKIFLEMDMGLARWGASAAHLGFLASLVLKNQNLQLLGIAAHLDYVPGLLKTEGESKLSHFADLASELEKKARRKLIKSCANTAVFLDFPSRRMDLSRIGNLLYGVNPTKTAFPVRNIWTFYSRVMSVRRLERGSVIGYGGEYLATKPMRVASVACGFADGLTMEPAHHFIRLSGPPAYYAKFRGKRLPLLGRPGLGHALLDASAAPQLKPGDAVELPIRRTAASSRIPRIYK